MAIDRAEVNRALSKAIAFSNCGQKHKANVWATRLVMMLECHGILTDNAINDHQDIDTKD